MEHVPDARNDVALHQQLRQALLELAVLGELLAGLLVGHHVETPDHANTPHLADRRVTGERLKLLAKIGAHLATAFDQILLVKDLQVADSGSASNWMAAESQQ